MNMLELDDLCTIAWEEETGSIIYIDQTLLPGRCEQMRCTTVEDLARAIRRLEIRGAPALGIAGAMGVALAAARSTERSLDRFLAEVGRAADLLRGTRPTAVNLAWGIDRVIRRIAVAASVGEAKTVAVAEAKAVADEDELVCRRLGAFGEGLFPDDCTVLTTLTCRCWDGPQCDPVGCGRKNSGDRLQTRPLNRAPGSPAGSSSATAST